MGYIQPGISDFKSYFFRDFPYTSDGDLTGVTDADITNAMQLCSVNFNEGLFADQQTYQVAFLLLSAHFLVMNLRASSQGIAGQYEWLQSSKSAGSVSEGLSIPQRILDNPEFAMLSKTNYGAQYLMMILPQLSGQVFIVCGRTTP